jgi:hypothetical protein
VTDWAERREDIRQRIKAGDIDNFLSWPVVQATMHVGDAAPYIQYEREEVHDLTSPYVYRAESNLVHQAYHLKQWLDRNPGVMIKDGTIVEIGGGYGTMALAWRGMMGFKGQYLIYDFPEMRQVQTHYLKKHGIDDVRDATLPLRGDLLIACFSLSEMSLEEREQVLDACRFTHHLVAYVPHWDGVDNNQYFKEWGGTIIEHPLIGNVRYSVR